MTDLKIGLSLSCIDYRLFRETIALLERDCCVDAFDHVILAGASLGYNQHTYKSWRVMYLEHVELAIKLHNITKIVVIDHEDCGAYKLFYPNAVDHPHIEKELHIKNIKRFIRHLKKIYPQFPYAGYLLMLDGSVETIYKDPCM